MVVQIQVKVFWVVIPCSVVVGWQYFTGLCCLHLQGWTWRKQRSSEMLLSYHNTIWCQNPEDLDMNGQNVCRESS